MLFIEIALTTAAWKRGWGAKALLPLLCGVVIGIFLGLYSGLEGPQAVAALKPFGILVDVCIIVALLVMRAHPREVAQPAKAATDAPSAEHMSPKAA